MKPVPTEFPPLPEPCSLTAQEESLLAHMAAGVVAEYCGGQSPRRDWEGGAIPESLRQRVGVFVTIFSGDDLRGCLGLVERQEPLWDAVRRLAEAAASRDTRFAPVGPEELPDLRVEITLLGPLVRLPSEREVLLQGLDPRVCGVYIRASGRTGLLLPQVARRLGWSAAELLEQVSLKAGLREDTWSNPGAEIYGFRARSLSEVRPTEAGRRGEQTDAGA